MQTETTMSKSNTCTETVSCDEEMLNQIKNRKDMIMKKLENPSDECAWILKKILLKAKIDLQQFRDICDGCDVANDVVARLATDYNQCVTNKRRCEPYDESNEENMKKKVKICESKDVTCNTSKNETSRTDECRTDECRMDKGRTDECRTDECRTDECRMDKGRTDECRTDKGRTDECRVDKGRTDECRTDECKMDKGRTDECRMDKGRTDKGRTDECRMDKGKTDENGTEKCRMNRDECPKIVHMDGMDSRGNWKRNC